MISGDSSSGLRIWSGLELGLGLGSGLGPSACSRLATVEAKRRSPPHAVIMSTYSGPCTWLER